MSIDASARGTGIIFNRSHVGEMVYAPIYRDYSGDFVLDIEKKWEHYKPFWDNSYLITFVASAEELASREDGRSLSLGKLDQIRKEIDYFKVAHEKCQLPNKILIDCTDKSIDNVFGSIINFLSI